MISSPHNAIAKEFRLLRDKKSYREKQGLFTIEGVREIKHAVNQDWPLKLILYCPEFMMEEGHALYKQLQMKNIKSVELSPGLYQKLAVRQQNEGLLAVAHMKYPSTDILTSLGPKDVIAVYENLEKPGNLGAILRTAEAAGIKAIILTGCSVDVFNPHVVRASLGACFIVPVYVMTMQEVKEFLIQQKIDTYVLTPQATRSYQSVPKSSNPRAWVFGSEAHGLTDFWLDESLFTPILIPMKGQMDSLNLSVSSAIVFYHDLT